MPAHAPHSPLKIGIAGLGTVGLGVVKLLEEHKAELQQKLPRNIVIKAVSARHKSPQRQKCLPPGVTWYDDACALAKDPNIDAVLELIGGAQGIAYDVVLTALLHKKPVITGNKALIAEHGVTLTHYCQQYQTPIFYEAAVTGGIPSIKVVRETLIGDRITALTGILNGTSNYVLTNMLRKGQDLDDVVGQAQQLGYAEADPTADIDGYDAAHKLAILNHLAFASPLDMRAIDRRGIRDITMDDHNFAAQIGCHIKLVGHSRYKDGHLTSFVAPSLVPQREALAHVDDARNALYIESVAMGSLFLEGPGAGEGPTALAVISDIADLAFGRTPMCVEASQNSDMSYTDVSGPHYVRIDLTGREGELEHIFSIFASHHIPIASLLRTSAHNAKLAFITSDVPAQKVKKACDELHKLYRSSKNAFMMPLIGS